MDLMSPTLGVLGGPGRYLPGCRGGLGMCREHLAGGPMQGVIYPVGAGGTPRGGGGGYLPGGAWGGDIYPGCYLPAKSNTPLRVVIGGQGGDPPPKTEAYQETIFPAPVIYPGVGISQQGWGGKISTRAREHLGG